MKTAAHTIKVKSSAGTYHVKCAPGLLRQAQKEISRLGDFSSIHLLTSPRVWKSVGPLLGKSFTKRKEVNVLLFEDTETRKELRSVEEITRKLVRAGADRQSLIVAIGGGVVGDVAGYVAASYLRGVALVQVPTTLVAQVDSAVGGKTGVNLPEGKNLVGAFYPASLVLVDPLALNSLPEREFRGGLAEVIKYGVIADAKLFAFLEKNFDAILERKPAALGHIIRRSLEIKARVVSEDEIPQISARRSDRVGNDVRFVARPRAHRHAGRRCFTHRRAHSPHGSVAGLAGSRASGADALDVLGQESARGENSLRAFEKNRPGRLLRHCL